VFLLCFAEQKKGAKKRGGEATQIIFTLLSVFIFIVQIIRFFPLLPLPVKKVINTIF